MSKISQKIVLFIEPNDNAFETPLKIGNLFMNRFAVDEDAATEILKIFELGKYSLKMSHDEKKQKGMDLIISLTRLLCFCQLMTLQDLRKMFQTYGVNLNDQKQFLSPYPDRD